MKQGRFIRDPKYIQPRYDHPWAQGHSFNAHSISLPDFGGISTFVKTFSVDKEVRTATLRASALGVFDLFLNGERVGTKTKTGETVYEELKPGWTDYRFRAFEFTYDITSALQNENRLAVELAPGWWSGRISFGYYGFLPPAVVLEIEIVFTDGEILLLPSDESFLVSREGRVRSADIWDGEYVDATRENLRKENGSAPFVHAVPYDGKVPEIVPHVGEPIRVAKHLSRTPRTAVLARGTKENGTEYGEICAVKKAVGLGCEQTAVHAGERLILDFGQNLVGRPHFTVRAERGTRIEGFVAEFLNDSGDPMRGNDGPKGSLYLKNYRSALARTVYIASGEETESYFPTHTFYGFRYYELTADRDFTLLSFTAEVLRSDLKETSAFSCSNPEINQLYSNILWGMRGNYLSIPTDCPQRDERLGWSGDTQLFAGAASYLADTSGFLRKWLGDARHSQEEENGAYCDVIPRVFRTTHGGNAAWGDAGITVPYRLYLMYGDTETLEEHYPSMESYMHYLAQFGYNGPNTAYGDWLCYEKTDKRLIAVLYYAEDAALMAKFSHLLAEKSKGEKKAFYCSREAHYSALRKEIESYFLKTYYPDGSLLDQTQTAYLLTLKFGLIPEADRAKTVLALKTKIEENDYTLSTGFVGTSILNQTLEEIGLSDLAYSLLLQTKDPSWLYSVRQGATTIWERWNSYTKQTGFGDVNMNSFNHYAYGAVAEWLFSGMCGIRPLEKTPGFTRFRLFPTPDTRVSLPEGQKPITYAEAAYLSKQGEIKSKWQNENGEFVYTVTVPEGTTADFGLPLSGDPLPAAISLNHLDFTPEELGAKRESGRLVFPLSPGTYTVKAVF